MSPHESDPESFDDETVRIPRTAAKDVASADPADAADDVPKADAAIDDRTAVATRGSGDAPFSGTDDLEATGSPRSAEPAAPVSGATEAPGPRRAPAEGDDPEPDEGSTMVVRRETRRRDARDLEARVTDADGPDSVLASTRAADVPAPVRRIARSPELAAKAYTARTPHVARAERTTPEAHPPQDYVDTAALRGIGEDTPAQWARHRDRPRRVRRRRCDGGSLRSRDGGLRGAACTSR